MKLRILDGVTGAVLLESIVTLGGYAVDGHVLLEFSDGASRHPVCAMHLDAGEAADLAASIQAMGICAYHVHRRRVS